MVAFFKSAPQHVQLRQKRDVGAAMAEEEAEVESEEKSQAQRRKNRRTNARNIGSKCLKTSLELM